MSDLHMRLSHVEEMQLDRLARKFGGRTAAIRHLLESASARDAEDFAWALANIYGGPNDHATLTVTVNRDGVSTSTNPEGPPLSQYARLHVHVAAQIVVELHGLEGDPEFAGVVLPVAVLGAGGGSITVAFEDLAPSLQPRPE